jgi:putative transposase
VDPGDPDVSIAGQARLLGLSRTDLCYRRRRPSEEEVRLKHRIDEIYTARPIYGSRRIREMLRREGFLVNRKAVRRHMREMGIEAVYPGPNLSKRRHDHQIYPYLLTEVEIRRPNQVWGTDITYIRMAQGWMYLTAIMDWYSRYVVVWELADTLEGGVVCEAVARALSCSRPEILNSDQGRQFTSEDYTGLLSDNFTSTRASAPANHIMVVPPIHPRGPGLQMTWRTFNKQKDCPDERFTLYLHQVVKRDVRELSRIQKLRKPVSVPSARQTTKSLFW